MREFFKELSETKLVRITGSFADCSFNENSDIDFYVKEDKLDSRVRNFDKILLILKKYGIKWSSTFPGYIFTHKTPNTLERQLEFSDLFKPRKNRLKEVELEGIVFKTY